MTALSSRLTILFKFCFAPLWGVLWGYGTYLLFNAPDKVIWVGSGTPPPWGQWMFLVILALGGYACRGAVRLKRVAVDGDGLWISNYFRSIHIPLARVARAGIDGAESYGVGGSVGPISLSESRPTCVIDLKADTIFGREIRFIPRSREAVATLRSRLGPTVGKLLEEPPRPPAEPEEFYGRGTV